ncbi:serine hydrolase domain-containing protein [Alkalibacillus haloalkaliphilus]|uniref:Serine hydrolase n=1 Tax=Alkalibacillus haloalkaliphilus TaxID=94136 RepID=A0A511W3Y7_9BACI|nr:serine hydrolase domain-containing protein [Alkalibacillus haloalkaliphilus]GEN45471.1 serine hydrolase [Alkalibacillus haloalkaliphilus]
MKQVWVKSYETYIEEILDKYQVPGAAFGVVKGGEVIYERGFGYRNVDEQLEVNEDTIFGIASITKSFTGVAIMQLQEAGELSVEDKAVKYLPVLNFGNKQHTEKVTIHHLLTHTAGLPPLPSLYHAMRRSMENDSSVSEKQMERVKSHEPIETYEELMTFIGQLEVDLLGEPGEEFSYSNDCYALLGAIIERVSGVPYDQYVTENILKPAGMVNSTFKMDEVLQSDNVTTIYATEEKDGEKEVYASEAWWDSYAMCAGGFLRSTLADMMRYTEIFRNEGKVGESRIITPESVQVMIQPHVQFQDNKYYGYGLMITPNYNGGTLVEHGGSLKGVSSNMGVVPEKGLACVVLNNLSGVPAFKLMLAGFNAAQDIAPEKPLTSFNDYAVNETDFDLYVGIYKSGEGAEVAISKEDDKLYYKGEGEALLMRPVGEHLFTIEISESESPIRFLFNNEGEVRGLFHGVRQIPKALDVEEEVETR